MAASRPKLVIICNDLAYFERHRRAIFDGDIAAAFETAVYCPQTPGARGDSDAIRYEKVAMDRFRFSALGDVRLVADLVGIFFRERPDVVHTITVKPNLLGGIALRLYRLLSARDPLLVMMSPGLGRIFAEGGIAARLRRRLVERGLRFALGAERSRAVFENYGDRRAWVSRGIVTRSRTAVVRGTGIDVERFRPPECRISPPPLKILFASRLMRSKGIAALIEAAGLLEARGANIEVVIAGDTDPGDPDAFPLEGRALPASVTYLGFREDIGALLAEAHVACLPTHYGEGIPRILIEAAASACALVSSDLPSCRLIVRDGETGIVVARRNGAVAAADLADALEKLAAAPDRVAALGQRARAFVVDGGFEQRAINAAFRTILSSS